MSDEADDQVETDDELITCWCGATGTFDELFDDEVYEQHCGGTGTLHCECGGDFCVCHHHGEVDCDGCPDCEADEDDDYEGMADGFDDEQDS